MAMIKIKRNNKKNDSDNDNNKIKKRKTIDNIDHDVLGMLKYVFCCMSSPQE